MADVNQLKIVGIVVDNYKVKRFKEALTAAGFMDITVSKFSSVPSLMRVLDVPAERIHDIHRICWKLETDFQRSN